jgi:hypothetical protein
VRATTQLAKLHSRDDRQWAAVGRFTTSLLIFFLDYIGVNCDLTAYTTAHSTQYVGSDSKQAASHGHPWAQHALESLLVLTCRGEPHAHTLFHANNE